MKKIVLLLLVVTYSQVFAQNFGVIKGKVIDKEDGKPLTAANIFVEGQKLGTATNFKGDYLLHIPNGTYTLIAGHVGYKDLVKKITVDSLKPLTLNFHLEKDTAIQVPKMDKMSGCINGKAFFVYTGEIIEGAEISVMGKDYSAVTNDKGIYAITNVPIGLYTLVITYSGNVKSERLNVMVYPNKITTINFNLPAPD